MSKRKHVEKTRLKTDIRNLLRPFVFPVIIGIVCSSAAILWNAWKQEQIKLTPIVRTSDGFVQGSIAYSRDGQEYWQFLGIPYATVDQLFQPPVSVKPWKHVKQVTSFPPNCAQYDVMASLQAVGEMDCLHLNVFVNVASNNTVKPVLVYIHGGAFISGGSKTYQPDYLMDMQDIVVVTMNYRLGPYGFLNLKDMQDSEDIPKGNMGLKDQRMALQWVQKNIDQFGGNPGKVTIFGESAGAVATHLHVLSPMSRGLFHRAVIQSGSALTPWAFYTKPTEVAMEYAKKVGCNPEDSNAGLLACYKSMEWQDLVKHQNTLMEPIQTNDIFGPTIDGTFLNESPLNILRSGDFPPVPVMFGLCSGEGGIRSGRFEAMPELVGKFDEDWTDLLSNFLLTDEPFNKTVAMTIKEKYFENNKFTEDLDGFKRNLTLLVSDASFFYPTHKSALYHARNGAPTYLYYFNYTSRIYPGFYTATSSTRIDDWQPGVKLLWALLVDSLSQYIFGGLGSRKYGVSHGDDLFQLWNFDGVTKYFAEWDEEFSRSFVKAIVDFANDTKPLTYRGERWPSINDYLASSKDEYSIPYMLLDNEEEPRVVAEPFGNQIRFWADFEY